MSGVTIFFGVVIPYVAGAIVAVAVGYRWGRSQIVTNHFLTKFIRVIFKQELAKPFYCRQMFF